MKLLSCVMLVGLLAITACDTTPGNQVPPEQAAEKFTLDLGLKMQGKPNCTQTDSDNDGYVSCTVAIVDRPEGPVRLVSLQCAVIQATTWRPTSGCKETQPVVPKSNQ